MPLTLLSAASVRAEVVVGAYLGSSKTASAPLRILQPATDTDVTLASVAYAGESFTPPLYYGVRLAWFPHETSWLGVETEFIHLKAYADTTATTHMSGRRGGAALDTTGPIASIVQRFSISHGLNYVLVNGVVRRTIAATTHPLTLAARAGLGPTIPHAESVVDGMAREGYQLGGLGVQVAAGLQWRVLGPLALLAEYKFTRTRQSVTIDRGEARGVFGSHHAVVGLEIGG